MYCSSGVHRFLSIELVLTETYAKDCGTCSAVHKTGHICVLFHEHFTHLKEHIHSHDLIDTKQDKTKVESVFAHITYLQPHWRLHSQAAHGVCGGGWW